ncbi:hypothetical protein E4U17_005532 [Claviceps sp. LM77 group G4]|nr:hypothetical protein E4U17_005532 [Claviceps sp. LM77 group G4]
MRLCIKAASAVVLAGYVVASLEQDISGRAILRTDDVLRTPYSVVLNTTGALPSTPILSNRKGTSAEITAKEAVSAKENSTLNIASWNAATGAACTKTLSLLPRSSNPSGNCVCYNIPTLDLQTGIFEAELRLYHVSDPRDEFVGVSPESVRVGLQYHGASISPITEKEVTVMGLVQNQTRMARRDETVSSPSLLETLFFVGRIDAARLAHDMTLAGLQEVLIPTFTLSATDPLGTPIQTNVSLNEAAFLTGVFSEAVILSDWDAAQAAVSARLDALHNGTAALVLPGVHLMLFPTGTVIVSVWLAMGLIFVGFGTLERMKYAKEYRKMVAGG